MSAALRRVIVTSGTSFHARGKAIHHQYFPEVHAEAESSRAAALFLISKLVQARESAESDRVRQAIEAAIAEVERFAHRCGRPGISGRKAHRRA